MVRFFQQLYLSRRLFLAGGVLVCLFIFSYLFPVLFPVVLVAFWVLIVLWAIDTYQLFSIKNGITAKRIVPERLSNGDPNPIQLLLSNHYTFPTSVEIIDEIPIQFQLRDLAIHLYLKAGEQQSATYTLYPVKRGIYLFGVINVFVSGRIGLSKRRYQLGESLEVPCYPSYIQMRKYRLMAISNRLAEMGVKPIRRLGHTTEFEQIKTYVRGDDYRTINWKATARAQRLMVNQYMDEKAQDVYCLIDKSRVMKMPFEGMTLLDYAINASLVIANIALFKQDKAGLITFSHKIDTCIPANNRNTHMQKLLEVLYHQDTQYKEASYERLMVFVRRKLPHRALLILFTNFETLSALKRQLPYLRQIGKNHLLLVVFFENTALDNLLETRPVTTEDIYIQTIGSHFLYEKKQIVKELERHGILAVLTPPKRLTVQAVNQYLMLKANRRI